MNEKKKKIFVSLTLALALFGLMVLWSKAIYFCIDHFGKDATYIIVFVVALISITCTIHEKIE